MAINLTHTDRNILIDLIDEALTETFILESDYGPDYTDEGFVEVLTNLKKKLENSNENPN